MRVVHDWRSLAAIHEKIVQKDRLAPVQVKAEEAVPVGVLHYAIFRNDFHLS